MTEDHKPGSQSGSHSMSPMETAKALAKLAYLVTHPSKAFRRELAKVGVLLAQIALIGCGVGMLETLLTAEQSPFPSEEKVARGENATLDNTLALLVGAKSAIAGEVKTPALTLSLAIDTHLSSAHLERLAVELKRLSHLEGVNVHVLLRGLPGRMVNHAPDKAREAALLQLRPFLLRGVALEIDPPRVRALTDLLGTMWPESQTKRVATQPLPPSTLLWVETAETGVFVDGVSSVERALGLLLRESNIKEELTRLLGQDTRPVHSRNAESEGSRLKTALSQNEANAWDAGKNALPQEVRHTIETLELPVSWLATVMGSEVTAKNANSAERMPLERALPPDPLEWEAGESRLARLRQL